MPKQTYIDEAYRSFAEEVAGALAGKEGYAVELGATGGVQLVTTGLAIGVIRDRAQGSGAVPVNVRMFGKGGTTLMVQSAAIAAGARVRAKANDGRAETAPASSRSVGFKISPFTSGAAGDIIEVLDVVENI